MRKKAWKKNIAILLVIAMILTIMPMTVFAEGNEGTSENDATSESVQSFLLNEVQSEVEVEAGVQFNVVVEATTDSAVKVQWTIGNDTNETKDLVVVGEQKTSTIAFENGLTETTVVTATFLDETGDVITDEDSVSATFTVKENVALAKTITVNAEDDEATYKTI